MCRETVTHSKPMKVADRALRRGWMALLLIAAIGSADRPRPAHLSAEEGAPTLWTDAHGRPTADARHVLRILREASGDGLNPREYSLDRLRSLEHSLDSGSADAPTDVTSFEHTLSAAMLRYLTHVHMGRVDPRSIEFRLDVPPDQHDFPAELRRAVEEGRVAQLPQRWRPPLRQYEQLRAALAAYRPLALAPAMAIPPTTARVVRPGEAYAGVQRLEALLAQVGDLPTPSTTRVGFGGLYDGPVVDGVKRFQRRHGLEPDGVLGSNTMAALRTSLSWRVRQIELALERLRWLPHLDDERLIALNIPMFRLWAWDRGAARTTPRVGMDVIVGRAIHTQTPVFVEEMRAVIIRPYWNVPPSILHNEILPRLERDPDYLRREQMELVRGDGDNATPVGWSNEALRALRSGALRVRQRPGPRNALELIKFEFPNVENVYMHGTPAHALFARSRRDFSHGCVGVADPVALGEWALQDSPAWNRERLQAAMAGTRTIRIALPRSIHVLLFYTTAVAIPEGGALHFADDIYGHDLKLHRALIASAAGQ